MNPSLSLKRKLYKVEFVDPLLVPDTVFNPCTSLNKETVDKPAVKPLEQVWSSIDEVCNASAHTGNASDPLELTEVKLESDAFETEDKPDIKLEEIEIKEEVLDVGDHNYAVVTKIDHSYAKSWEQDMQRIENIRKWTEDCRCDRNADVEILRREGTIKEEIAAADEIIDLVDEFPEGFKIPELISIKHEEENQKLDEIQTVKCEDHVGCDKTIEYAITNQSATCSSSGEKDAWRIDLTTPLNKTYLKERGLPVSKKLPVNPLHLSPVIDLSSDNSSSETITASDNQSSTSDDKLDIPEQARDETYTCSICSYSTTQKCFLKNHVRIHSAYKLFKCAQCGFKADCKWNLEEHMRIHTREKPFKCPKCPYSGLYQYNLEKHLARHPDIVPYVCGTCGFRSKDECLIAAHKKAHDGSLKCRLCGFATTKTFAMETHMTKHARKKSYRCYKCDFVSWYHAELVAHKFAHPKMVRCNVCNRQMSEKTYEEHRKKHQVKCFECGFVAASNWDLKLHTAKLHTGKSYRCASCDYVTHTRKELLIHMESHTQEKPYKCMKCGYSSVTSADVDVHMKTHASEVPYKCLKCPYKTPFSINLLDHMDTHTENLLSELEDKELNEKTHSTGISTNESQEQPKPQDEKKILKCNECNFACEYQTELDDHLQGHLKYQCSMCGCNELSRLDLKKHLQIHIRRDFKVKRSFNSRSCKRSSRQRLTIRTSYKCRSCDYSSEDRFDMRSHMWMHVLERPCKFKVYDCAGAMRAFRKRPGEKRTLLWRKFSCSGCEYTSASEGALRQHVRMKHKVKMSKN